MKYLKLFEAFESEILSATLKFLSQKGKKDFSIKEMMREAYFVPENKIMATHRRNFSQTTD